MKTYFLLRSRKLTLRAILLLGLTVGLGAPLPSYGQSRPGPQSAPGTVHYGGKQPAEVGLPPLSADDYLSAIGSIPAARPLLDELIDYVKRPGIAAQMSLNNLPQDENGFSVVTTENLEALIPDQEMRAKMRELIRHVNEHVAQFSTALDHEIDGPSAPVGGSPLGAPTR